MEAKDKKYFEYLDALRCLAFLAVFYAHTGTVFIGGIFANSFLLNVWQKFTVYGAYGVNFFFVLSGFLITYLLLKEKKTNNKISVRKFYIRRILRIWPVYFINLFFAVFILPYLISSNTYKAFPMADPHISSSAFYYFSFFLGNIYQGLKLGMGPLSVGVLWSVGVEEQFYLVWPWIMKWFDERKLIFIIALLISLSLLYKFLWADDRVANYYLPMSVGMDLAFGALIGIFYYAKKQRQIIFYSLSVIGGSILVIFSALAVTYSQVINLGSSIQLSALKSSFIDIVRLMKSPIIDCVFALIILFFAQRSTTLYEKNSHPFIAFFHLSRKKIKNGLIYLGKISYGLYAYHTICLMIMVQIFYKIGFLKTAVNQASFFMTIISAFILTVIVANTSYTYIEKRLLALKDKIS